VDERDLETVAARAAGLLKRAERYRGLAAKAAERETALRLRRMAQELESEAAIEMAHAALMRNAARDDETTMADTGGREKE